MSERSPRESSDASTQEGVGAALKRESRELAGEAKSAAYRAARERRDAVAGFVSALKGAADRGAEELEESGFGRSAAALRRTAGEVGGLAERLQQREPVELWDDVESFAREHPVLVFGASFALAFGLARVLKSGIPDEYGDEEDAATPYQSARSSASPTPSGSSTGSSGISKEGRSDPLAGDAPAPQSSPAAGGARPAGT
jgi:hypothetical protein